MANRLDCYYEELVELIYQIPLQHEGWSLFARRLIDILDASYVHIQAIDFTHNVLSFSNGVGKLPIGAYARAELDYLRYPIEADPRWGKFLDPERKGWYQCHTHVSEQFVQESELYQKILLPFGLRFVATHELIWDERLCVFWSVSTTAKRQPLNQEELAFLDGLLTHLKRLVIAQKHLYEFSLDNIVGYNLIDKIPQPIILLNLSGQIVHYNQAIQLFLADKENIEIKQNQLILPEPYQNRLSETLYQIESAFRYQQAQLEQFKNINIQIMDDTRQSCSIHMTLLVSEKEMSFFGIRPLLMLKLHNLTYSKIYLPKNELILKYKLTKRELEICQLFSDGMSLEQIAGSCGITISSLRTYLKHIFAKTKTSSQTELMRLLLSTNLRLV